MYYVHILLRRLRYRRYTLEIGKHTYGRPVIRSFAGSNSKITIGKYCSIARNVKIICGSNHHIEWVSTFPFRILFNLPGQYKDGHPFDKGPVVIGNDVWLGDGVTILSGVKIGDGAVLAAGAFVVKDVEPYSVVGGNPARHLKYRFPEEQIRKLLKIRWWDWSDDKVIANVSLLSSVCLDEFIRLHSANDHDE
jgi:acetyltransferase-like isoleucine patch superfamily enzyme